MTFRDFITGTTAPWWWSVITALAGVAVTYFVTIRTEERSAKRAAVVRTEERTERARINSRAELLVDVRGILSLTEQYIVQLSTVFVGRTPIGKGFTIDEYRELMSYTQRFSEFVVGLQIARAEPLVVASFGLYGVVRDFKFDFDDSEDFKDYIGRLRSQANNVLRVATKYLNLEKLSDDDLPSPDYSAKDREVMEKAMAIVDNLKKEHPEWYK